jgi:hypothetical protein
MKTTKGSLSECAEVPIEIFSEYRSSPAMESVSESVQRKS